MEVVLHVKRPFFLSDSNQTLISSAEFRKIPQHGTSHNFFGGGEVVPSARTDRQTDMTKIVVAFHIFAKRALTL
jgi:hypothetical protein